MDYSQLIELLPQGASVIAVLAVVVIFLKQQDKFGETLKQVATSCHTSHTEARADYQRQVAQLVEGYKNSTERQTQATKDLEGAVRQLNNTVLLLGRESIK